MIPDYLIKLLVYFMLTTSKYINLPWQSKIGNISVLLTFPVPIVARKLQDGETFD